MECQLYSVEIRICDGDSDDSSAPICTGPASGQVSKTAKIIVARGAGHRLHDYRLCTGRCLSGSIGNRRSSADLNCSGCYQEKVSRVWKAEDERASHFRNFPNSGPITGRRSYQSICLRQPARQRRRLLGLGFVWVMIMTSCERSLLTSSTSPADWLVRQTRRHASSRHRFS